MSKNGRLYFHDFGTGEMLDAVSAVMKKFGITYSEATKKISEERHLFAKSVKIKTRPRLLVDIVEGNMDDYADYWQGFHIPLAIVKMYAKLAKSVYLNETYSSRSTRTNPVFAYRFPSGNIKLYRPLSPDKEKKWGGNSTSEDIGGLMQLPKKGTICVITSSIKDVMVLRQHGFPAICFNGETYGVTKGSDSGKVVATIIEVLKKRFKRVLLFLDNDEAGVKSSIKWERNYNVPYTVLKTPKLKDISDYQKKYGPHKTFRIIKRLVSKKFKEDEVPF